ncbi:hypothetical protein ASA1KI_04360 [Opitutales bacterium ASA1]|uniref:hypothetical protein n=1 Tax=Congregicoccus parvus TaxID=3081749 RepID=UPI002B2D3B58|nr:hypothetical protein ASA1KI_04360 [Opitutales bacterium ASA1]
MSLFVLVASSAHAAAPSLADVLTAEEFERAGLKKLTPEELAFLSARVLAASEPAVARVPVEVPATAAATPAAAPALRGEAAFGQEQKIIEDLHRAQVIPKEIRSRILGSFRGWSGKTVFRLENGQVWRQTSGGTFAVSMTDPVVVVQRGAFGTYFLSVEGYGSRTKVERVE